MYTDEDLDKAVEKGIFSDTSVSAFRAYISEIHSTFAVDEENFRLVTSFNDIFVVIACILALFSSAWVGHGIHPALAPAIVACLSWGLAEFFVLKRKMALPAIVLLISFVGALFAFFIILFGKPTEQVLLISATVSSLGAWVHWRRFKVPITVAAGVATTAIFAVSLLLSIFPSLKEFIDYFVFFSGIVTFYIAMRWDASDLDRTTSHSDIAFWLHLAAAPMIVHPIFSNLGIFEGDQSLINIMVILLLYIALILLSLIIDRRAFMVSSLAYVLFALTTLLKNYGLAGDSFAFVGVLIGFSLLLLSGFWHKARHHLIACLPQYIRGMIPSMNAPSA